MKTPLDSRCPTLGAAVAALAWLSTLHPQPALAQTPKADGFAPSLNDVPYALAIQPDGKVLVGGALAFVGLDQRNAIARLNADGTPDAQFDTEADGPVYSLALQPDGKILVGGAFTMLAGQPSSYLARLNPDGTLDGTFDPQANGEVYCLAVQPDGKLLVGGDDVELAGEAPSSLARVNADGTPDDHFAPQDNGAGLSVGLQADGRILAGGERTFERLNNTELATQAISCDGSTITWMRGGSSPEAWRTTFEVSTNGADWTMLGDGSRVPGGWQLSGVAVPTGGTVRARGYVVGGEYCASSWFVETLLPPGGLAPPLIILNDGHFGFGANGFGFDVSGAAGQVAAVDGSSNLVNWLPLQTNTLSSGSFYFSDPGAEAKGRQFYRARLVQ